MRKGMERWLMVLLLAAASFGLWGCPGGEEENNSSACADDEVRAIGASGDVSCYKKCITALDCGSGEACRAPAGQDYKLCQPGSSSNNMMTNNNSMTTSNNNTMSNNNNSSNTNTNTNTNTGNNTMSVAEKCEAFCEKIAVSCLVDNCDGLTQTQTMNLQNAKNLCLMGGTVQGQTLPPCEQNYANNADYKTRVDEELSSDSCDRSVQTACYQQGLTMECGCAPTNYGEPCMNDLSCNGGSLQGICGNSMSGLGPYPGGMCLAADCNVPAGTMAGRVIASPATGCVSSETTTFGCAVQPLPGGGGTATTCVPMCTSDDNCPRDGYVCAFSSSNNGMKSGLCRGECGGDMDCQFADAEGNRIQGKCGAGKYCLQPCENNMCENGGTCVEGFCEFN